jgi:hemoglobin
MNLNISEDQIAALVDSFYSKARLDPEIGPIFNSVVDDWPLHLAILKDFWSSVLLGTGRYKGSPVMRHLQIGLDPQHFERWLSLFAETAQEIFPPESAAVVVEKSRMIAQNLQIVTTNPGKNSLSGSS